MTTPRRETCAVILFGPVTETPPRRWQRHTQRQRLHDAPRLLPPRLYPVSRSERLLRPIADGTGDAMSSSSKGHRARTAE